MIHRKARRDAHGPSIRSVATRTRALFALTLLCVALVPATALAAGGLVLVPDFPILISLIIFFVILVSPMNKLIFQPLFKVLDERAAQISGARSRAQQLQQEADATMSRYRDAIRAARENSEATRQTQLSETRSEQSAMTADAKSEAASEIARARAEIEASLGDARASLRASSEEVAKIAAEQILGRSLT